MEDSSVTQAKLCLGPKYIEFCVLATGSKVQHTENKTRVACGASGRQYIKVFVHASLKWTK